MRKFLLGCTDFARIRREGAFYVDKTRYIGMLEDDTPYLMFIRPRRFGKSLFLNLLGCYYDIKERDSFEELFSGLYIGSHPTPERGTYLILYFNFSMVADIPGENSLEQKFREYCSDRMLRFAQKYEDYFGKGLSDRLHSTSDAGRQMAMLEEAASACSLPIYVMIDEYDNFANNILAGADGHDRYRAITHGTGFFRSFFTILKGCTTSEGSSAVKRIFLTGVSPLVLDDVTSGFNIAQNISTVETYNGMLGFEETDILKALREIAEGLAMTGHKLEGTLAEHLAVMRDYYNNYCFCEECEHIFNTNMSLSYLNSLARTGKAPRTLVDTNSRMDYEKLRYLIVLEKRLNGNFNLLCDLAIDHCVQATLVDRFPLAELVKRNQFISLLFYMGILTIDGCSLGETIFRVPNRTVEEVLVGYIRDSLAAVGSIQLDNASFKKAGAALACEGNWRGMLEYIHQVIVECTSIRDFLEGEKCVQIAHLLALQPLACYVSRTEHEASKGYLDLILKPNRRNNSGVLYTYVLEFKYLKEEATDAEFAKAVTDARAQLVKYTMDAALQSDCAGTTLTLISVVYRKWDIAYSEAEGTLNLA